MKRLVAFALLALFATEYSTAQENHRVPDQNVQIVVTAPTPQAISAFVTNFASAPQYAYQMGRWDRHVCPGVIGLQRQQAQFLADRIATRAFQVGLHTGAPGCRADIAI
jgi:hypothetical protein